MSDATKVVLHYSPDTCYSLSPARYARRSFAEREGMQALCLAATAEAEIAFLEQQNEQLRGQNTTLDAACAHLEARVKVLGAALRYSIKQVPELATVPGIAAALQPKEQTE